MTGCHPSAHRNWHSSLLGLALAFAISATANAQQGQPAPQDVPSIPDHGEPQGFIPEPSAIERAAVFADRHLSGGGRSNGFYVSTKSPVQGSGWISLGPGYRHWYKNDSVFIDGSAGVSQRGYKVAQANVELPKLLRSRLVMGTTYRWQDFRSIKSYGEGQNTTEADASTYHLRSRDFVGYSTIRLARWLDFDANLGLLSPEVLYIGDEEPDFVHSEGALTADTRDFPDHPTKGVLLRAAAAQFNDQNLGQYSFRRYEAEAAGFLPIASSRVVLALRGWVVGSEANSGQTVPEYLQPNLGGGHSLRSFADFRFRDDYMMVGNIELRVALMTHVDIVGFADAGNVGARFEDLNLDKQSYGGGLRFHTRRATILRADFATGREGWRARLSLSEPLGISRTERRTAPFPFVP